MKKKNMIAICVIVILLLVCFVLLNSYALWVLVIKQEDKNYLLTACLDLEVTDADPNNTGINLTNAFPTSDEEGLKQEGYSFIVTNNCNNAIDYLVTLEALPTENVMPYENIRLQLDNGKIYTYSDLVDYENDSNADYEISKTKYISSFTAPSEGSNTHSIKMWIDENADDADSNKTFKSKIKIVAGQEITNEEIAITSDDCFTFNSTNGTITDYNFEECGPTVVFPTTVQGVVLKTISLPSNYQFDYVDLSNSVYLETISSGSFASYTNEEGRMLNLPDSLKIIKSSAFARFNNSQILIIPDSVQVIEDYAFKEYNGGSLGLGSDLQMIGTGAFQSYVGADVGLTIPDKVQTIGNNAFRNYTGTSSSLHLSNMLSTLGSNAFYSYRGIGQTLLLPPNLINVNNGTFHSFVGNQIIMGNGLKTIGSAAFYYFNGIEITFNNQIQSIESGAFSSFVGNQSMNIELPESLTNIGSGSFNNYIGKFTVYNCNSWQSRDSWAPNAWVIPGMTATFNIINC